MSQIERDLSIICAVVAMSGHPKAIGPWERICDYINGTANNSDYTAALEDIIKWLDGSNGSFPIRKSGEGAYYWRKEMTRRFNAAKVRHCV